jgi:hypothetical protein
MSTGEWPVDMLRQLNTAYPYPFHVNFTEENPRNWAVSGTTIADAASGIDGWLTGHTLMPNKDMNVFLINWGVIRDLDETEANFKSRYLYVIDAIKTKFPNAIFFLTYPWSGNVGTRPATIHPWIADVAAARSAYVFIGDDEAIWLEGGDNGATNTTDKTHYNAAGHVAKAAQEVTIITNYLTSLGY